MSQTVAVIGECMLELVHANANAGYMVNMGYGGDTINTAIYLCRNDIAVSYVTGLGDDIMSDWLLEEWAKEGLDCSMVARMPNSVPGMYMINIDDHGERSFLYWRKNSPASRLFDNPDYIEKLIPALSRYSHLYLSGISLAILPCTSRDRLFDILSEYRQKGGKLIYDGNYRPDLWSNAELAKHTYKRIYQITDIALPTFEDESLLFGYDSAEQVIRTISNLGVPEVVVKMGGEGCLAIQGEQLNHIAADFIDPVDTTAAGDSFNAGYLAARFKGESSTEACRAGHALAKQVIQHKGAIIPAT